MIEIPYSIAGFVVGVIVGLTGVGGGSLMTPLLVLGFGIPPVTAVVLCWTGHQRSAGTGPPLAIDASAPPVIAPADIPAARTRPDGPTSTTSSRTPTAAKPPARTSAACAAGTTDSRPTHPAGDT